jgi:hypothetical protein
MKNVDSEANDAVLSNSVLLGDDFLSDDDSTTSLRKSNVG